MGRGEAPFAEAAQGDDMKGHSHQLDGDNDEPLFRRQRREREASVWVCAAKRFVAAPGGATAMYPANVADEIARVLTAEGVDAESR